MRTTIETVRGSSMRLVLLSLLLAACQGDGGALGPEEGADGEAGMVATPGPATARAFGAPQEWSSFFCRKGEVCQAADVTGDGKADVIAFSHGANNSNAVFIARSNGTGFGLPERWSDYFCISTQTCAAGDVNGDGRADIVTFTRGTNPRVFVALSTGSGFGAPQLWSSFFCRNGEVCKVVDVHNDGRADLVAFRHRLLGNRNGVYVAASNGSSFGASQEWTTGFCHSTETCEVGDVTGGGKADILALTRDPLDDVYVGVSTGVKFNPPALWSSLFCRTGEVCLLADVSGDYRHDLIAFNHGLNDANAVYVGLSSGTGFGAPVKVQDFFCTKAQTCAVGDVNGDKRADLIAFTRGTNPRVFVAVNR